MADVPGPADARRRRGGFSLVEVMVVLTMTGIMIATAAPSFRRSIETARADLAVANLRAIWAAQRVYWIANRAYSPDIPTLVALDLVGPEVTGSSWPFQYAINPGGDTSFTVTAQRMSPNTYGGTFTIDQTGSITGSLASTNGSGEPNIIPPRSR